MEARINRPNAYSLRRAPVEKIHGMKMDMIPSITPTQTGWAIILTDLTTRDLTLTDRDTLLEIFRGRNVAVPTTWYNYAVKEIPFHITNLWGDRINTEQVIQEEIFTQTREKPTQVQISRHGADPYTGKST